MSRNLAPDPNARALEFAARFEGVELSGPDGNPPAARLSFALPSGSRTSLVGRPGVGKSRVLDLLSFHGRPSRGRIEVFGLDIGRIAPADRPRLRRRVGIVFQDRRLLADLTAFDNVALPARAAERRPPEYGDKVAELLAWVGLGARAGEPPGRLTEGERRRLCLARALINGPDLLLIDEPTIGLSDKSAARMLRLISEIHAAGTTVVIATTDHAVAGASEARVIDLSARATG